MFSRTLAFVALLLSLSFTLTACDSPEEQAAQFIKQGDSLLANQDYDRARVEYKNATQATPTNANAFYKLGLAFEATKDFAQAFQNFQTAEQQDKTHVKALEKTAQYYLLSKQYDNAHKRLTQLIQLDPANGQAYALRAMMAYRLNDIGKAETDSKLALKYDAGNVTAHAALAHIHHLHGDLDKALAITSDGIAKNPKDLSLHLLKITFLEERKDLEGTIKTFQKIFTIAPKNLALRYEFAKRLIDAKKLDLAEATFREAIALNPEKEEAKRAFIVFLSRNKGHDLAVKEIEKMVKDGLAEDVGQYWIAHSHLLHKQNKEAISILRKLSDNTVFEGVPLASRAVLAQLYYDQKDRKSTKTLVDQILVHNKNHPDALDLRAALMADTGDIDNALLTLQLLLRDNPSNRKALYRLAHISLQKKRFDLAMDTANKLYALDEDVDALFLKADVYTAMGHIDDAIALYKVLHEKNPGATDILNNYAFLLADYKSDNKEAMDTALLLVKSFENTDNLHLLDTIAWVYYRAGKIDKALPLIEKAMQDKESLTPELCYHYGAILAATGQKEAAKVALKQATEFGDTYSKHQDAVQLLEMIDK